MLDTFQIATLTPGSLQPSIAKAAIKAGGIGIVDFEYCGDRETAYQTIVGLSKALRANFGIRVGLSSLELISQLVSSPPEFLKTIVFAGGHPMEWRESVALLRSRNIDTLFEATCLEHAKGGESVGFDGLIAKGHEAGGRIADETTFILLQRFLADVRVPVWAHGGIGQHTAAACAAAGAAGIVLDSQLALTRESPLPESIKSRIAAMDGSETIVLGEQLGEAYRMYYKPGNPAVKELQSLEMRLIHDHRSQPEILDDWRRAVALKVGWDSEQNAWMLGQDAAFAASLAKRFRTVAGVLQSMREAIRNHCQAADRLRPLAEGSPMAVSHATRYPIMQGPMTRVSDVPEFAGKVAEGGALPFLALALMRGPEVRTLLAEAQNRLGSLPWGVGILGFVPPELRQEQMEVVAEYRPPFALIAGGRPDQANALEKQGIASYLHVPSPGLLQMFTRQGARRFVFEGRECGGHVGPRTSFVLWNQMVDVLLDSPEFEATPEQFHVVFAAGIHDALSASMVSVLAAPLAARGAKIGVLLGSAYLFTEEAVSSGAILGTFQEQARQCQETVLLETGPGHSTRCVATPYASHFTQEKRRLAKSGLPAEEVRLKLEDLNLGRLRIASKGLTRNTNITQDTVGPKLIEMDQTEQVAQGMYMIGQVAALRNTICTVQELHRDVSIEGSILLDGLASRFLQTPAARGAESPSDVAIVGMACLLPKAPDLPTYWDNILNKVDAIREIPEERWKWETYFDADPKAKDKIYSKWGGFLDDVAFDPMHYGMPPSSLRSIEPSQLLTLEVVRAALEDAGYTNRAFARDRTSVILGAGGGAADLGLAYGARSFIPNLEALPEFRGRTKEILERLDDRLPEWTEDSFAGILTNVAAGRVANRFDLGGSNYTVDAACASSLAAVSLGLKELEGKTSDMVIVGGIDTMQNPFTYLCFSKTHALSANGRCRTFDESADGIAISEGIAVVVLKRLEDAERDGDRIYAVIKAAGSSSDGKDRGLTAPRPEGQARALRRAYAKAGFSPATVGLVEAHGTGTVAGDGAEVEALTQVFSESKADRQGCAIGSVKSMIGHTKCTAGAAGLIKAALSLHHKVLPPTLGVQKPNPRARFPETPFFVNTEARPWLENPTGNPRRAGISAFGFGGTNFHIVAEEYKGNSLSSTADTFRQWSDELFLWKADTRQALLAAVDLWQVALAPATVKATLRDLAYTAWKQAEKQAQKKGNGSGKGTLQIAIVASSLDDLRQKLSWAKQSLAVADSASNHQSSASQVNDPRGIYFSDRPLAAEGKLAFLFPGQGSQYPHMLQDLLIHFPEMRRLFETAVSVLQGKLDEPLSSYVFPPPSFTKEEEKVRQQALTRTHIAQPALGAAGMAMFGLLQEFGLRPDMMAGHSYGEYVALAAAGVFDTETLIALSEARGRFIVEGAPEEPGTMAAVEADSGAVAEMLKDSPGAWIANANSPKQTIVSGTRAAVGQVIERSTAQGTTARPISVACAFHSPLVAPAQQSLARYLSTVHFAEPSIVVYSNTTAAPYVTGSEAIAAQLVEHLVRPVEFMREVEAMYAAGARIFVEVGPRGVLTSLVDQTLGDRPRLAAASNQIGRPGLTQLLHLLGQLAAHGVGLSLDVLYRDRRVQQLDLATLANGDKPLPASVWLVNGARARPLKEKAPRSTPEIAREIVPLVVQKQTAGVSPDQDKSAPPVALLPTKAPVPRVTASSNGSPVLQPLQLPAHPSPASLDGVPQVMAQFQQMMTRFLEAQQTVMLSYLGTSAGTATAPTAPTPVYIAAEPAPAVPAVSLQPTYNGHAPVVSPVVATLPSSATRIVVPTVVPTVLPTVVPTVLPDLPNAGPDLAEIRTRLLSIVSDRTGYPPEMLELHLDLEADLGIDSIKRVEILGTFQQSFSGTGVSVGEGMIETLAGARTLGAILDRVTEHVGGSQIEQPQIQSPIAEAVVEKIALRTVPGLGKQELTSMLLAIVSDRTGYPQEMLDLELDLEADLGIDSIKRVEILGTFQQSFAEKGLAAPEGMMEQLASVRTLQGIIDRVSAKVAGAPNHDAQQRQPASEHAFDRVALEPTHRPGKQELTAKLLAIVSDRTGYPEEMLALDSDLEADLGIDSIKRVEILGTFQQSFVEMGFTLQEGTMERLASVRTLRGIVGQLEGEIEGRATPEGSTAPAAPALAATSGQEPIPEGESVERFTLEAVDMPLSGEWQGVAKDRTILITDDGHGIARALTKELLGEGYIVALVRQEALSGRGEAPRELNHGAYAADLGSSEHVAQLVELVTLRQGVLGGIVHLLPLRPEASAALDLESWRERLRLGVKSLFYLAKAAHKQLAEAAKSHGACLIAATGMGGAFLTDLPSGAPAHWPEQGGVVGLVKTLALEYPAVRVKAVDLNLQESGTALAEHLLDEMNAEGEHSEVGYNGRRRIVLQLRPTPVCKDAAPAFPIDRSSVILVTGGARGITARSAHRLAEMFGPTIVLAGRSPLPDAEEATDTAGISSPKDLKAALMARMRSSGETVTPARVEQSYSRLLAEREVRGNLAALRQTGSSVHYHAVDVRDAQAFGGLIDRIYSSFGRLDGVIHGAGVIEDKLTQDKTNESFDRVFDTKVDSAFVLSQKLRPESLRFLVFFSSVSGRFGNRGQGDYAAANEVLNKLAVSLDGTWPGRVVAVNWGPWESGGMVSAEVRKQFAERGVHLISPESGVRRLEEELNFGSKGEAEVVIGGAAWNPASRNNATRQPWPLLREAVAPSSGGPIEFTRELDLAYDLYLHDHRLDGQPVLPLAVATELLAEAAAQGWPELRVAAVRNLRVMQGIVLENGTRTVRVIANPQPKAASGGMGVVVEIIGTGKLPRVHYRATVELAVRLPDAPSGPMPLTDGRAFRMSTADLYRQWLFHGPLFQGILRVDQVGPSGIQAVLATSAPSDWIADGPSGNWLFDPLVFDSALQLLVLWSREHWDMTALPSGFENFRRFASPSGSSILCEMRLRSNTGGQTIHADIFFKDAGSNRLLAVVEDMQGTCSKALNRLARGEELVAGGTHS